MTAIYGINIWLTFILLESKKKEENKHIKFRIINIIIIIISISFYNNKLSLYMRK